MKTKHLVLALAAALVVGGVIYTANAMERPGAGQPRRAFLKRAAEKLELTAAQKSQIKSVLVAEKDTLKTLLARLHETRQDLRTAIRADNATESSVRTASAAVASVESDLAVERLNLHGKIAPILTDEQKAKISEFETRVDDFIVDQLENLGRQLAN